MFQYRCWTFYNRMGWFLRFMHFSAPCTTLLELWRAKFTPSMHIHRLMMRILSLDTSSLFARSHSMHFPAPCIFLLHARTHNMHILFRCTPLLRANPCTIYICTSLLHTRHCFMHIPFPRASVHHAPPCSMHANLFFIMYVLQDNKEYASCDENEIFW